MLKLFPMRHQLSHRRHPLHPSSIRDVRSLLRIRFLKSLNDLHVLSFLSSLLHKMGPKYRRECLPNETCVLNLGKRKSEFLKLQHELFEFSYFQIGQACTVFLLINYMAGQLIWILKYTVIDEKYFTLEPFVVETKLHCKV